MDPHSAVAAAPRRTTPVRLTVLAMSFALAGLASASVASASVRTPTCHGEPATLVGTVGNDLLVGTSGHDVIVGLGGHDVIRGLGGSDVICGGHGDDKIRGGRGEDSLFGGPGNDTVHGSKNDAFVRGGAGSDLVYRASRFDGLSVPEESAAAALDYFREIGFSPEYGSQVPMIRKWRSDVLIAVHGSPTAADLAALDSIIADLDGLIDTIGVRVVSSGENLDLYFAPQSRFPEIDPSYVPGNAGFFTVRWDGSGAIYRATALVATDVPQSLRDHLLREELTQSLGLMSDSWSHPDSVFYQGWSQVDSYSALDRALIGMLYRPDLAPGMGETQAMAVLAGR